jgi:DNA-binding transcriptional LysR family regulator
VNLRHLEFVVGVADRGGFRRAAASLHISQSALSHAITTIEHRLGAPLFHRHGRGVTLTSVGVTFVEAARQVLDANRALEQAIAASTDLTDASLPIAMQATGVTGTATTLIAAMRRRHPGVRIEVTTRPTAADVHDELLNGTCEVGITDWASHRALESEPMLEERFALACPPGTELPSTVMHPGDRFPVPMILPTGWQRLRAATEHDDGYDMSNPVAVETESRDLMMGLVLAGAGAALLPETIAEAARAAGAVIVTLDPPLTRSVLLVKRPGTLERAAEAFVACAREVAEEERKPIDLSDRFDHGTAMDIAG